MSERLQNLEDRSVVSSLGWRLDILSINAVRYTDGDHSITLNVEDRPKVTGELEWILYTPQTWAWETGHQDQLITPEKIQEILNRISLAFWKLDMPIREIV